MSESPENVSERELCDFLARSSVKPVKSSGRQINSSIHSYSCFYFAVTALVYFLF